MQIHLKTRTGKILYSLKKSVMFPDYYAVIREAIAYDIDLTDLFVENEVLDDIIFRGIKMDGALFKNCSMKKVEFINCNSDSLYFENCNLSRIKFKKTKLKSLDFRKSDLSNSRFRNSHFDHLYLDEWNLSNSTFTNCILDESRFTFSNLYEVRYDHCSLINAVFSNYTFNQTWMQDVRFNYCNLDYHNLENLPDIDMLYINECNIQDAIFKEDQIFTKVINTYTTVLYCITSDVVWWDDFRSNFEGFKYEVENDCPTTHVDVNGIDYCIYDELVRVCAYLESWKE